MRVLVDMVKYAEVYGDPSFSERSRRNDYSEDYEEMDVEPSRLKELLDNCIGIKNIEEN